MAARYILAALALAFLLAAIRRGELHHPQARTWLLVAAIFAAVSGWLFLRG